MGFSFSADHQPSGRETERLVIINREGSRREWHPVLTQRSRWYHLGLCMQSATVLLADSQTLDAKFHCIRYLTTDSIHTQHTCDTLLS